MPLGDRIRRLDLLVVVLGLFAAVFALVLVVDDARQGITVVYVVPIALAGLAAGTRGGLVAALLATGLLGVWVGVDDVHIGAGGWISRLLAFFVIGGLVGHYEDIARRLVRTRLDERYAMEIHDGVVQALVMATYQLRAGEAADAQHSVDEALACAKHVISSSLPSVEPGDLRLRGRDGTP